MRNLLIVAIGLFVFGSLATAQIPTSGNVFAGYSYYNTDINGFQRQSLNGWEGSLEGKYRELWFSVNARKLNGLFSFANFLRFSPGTEKGI